MRGRPVIDIAGKRFGQVTVLSRAVIATTRDSFWVCLCDCGTQCTLNSHGLRRGKTKSCGCLQNEHHGRRNTPEYRSWSSMIQRCTNPNATKYKAYGGRGIRVCERWRSSFVNFYEDMGERPNGTSLDRINVHGDYEPSNCRWATNEQQASNTQRGLARALRLANEAHK